VVCGGVKCLDVVVGESRGAVEAAVEAGSQGRADGVVSVDVGEVEAAMAASPLEAAAGCSPLAHDRWKRACASTSNSFWRTSRRRLTRVLALPRSGRKPVHVRLREQGGLQDSVRTAALAMCRMHAFLARLTGRGLSRCAEMAFPPNLDNHDRAVVHSECKKYGFASKSYGCAPAPHSPVDWATRHPNQSNPDSSAQPQRTLSPTDDPTGSPTLSPTASPTLSPTGSVTRLAR
jgi:hypothetical protein